MVVPAEGPLTPLVAMLIAALTSAVTSYPHDWYSNSGPDLKEGQEVEFDIVQADKGPRAENLKRL